MNRLFAAAALLCCLPLTLWSQEPVRLQWDALAPLPDPLGVAGPFAGSYRVAGVDVGSELEVMIVAGGANFPEPVWESEKVWRDRVFVATRRIGQREDSIRWVEAGRLDRPIAYGASVSLDDGVLCLGGNDSQSTFRDCFVLRWDPLADRLETIPYPPLPAPCAYAAATRIGQTVYVAGGQHAQGLGSATKQLWALDLSRREAGRQFGWKRLADIPGPERAFHLTVSQHNGFETCVYVISGRRQGEETTEFLTDTWEYAPSTDSWRRRAEVPRCVMAGTGTGFGQSHLFVLGGASGKWFGRADAMKDRHPGFPRRALAYHTITDRWTEAGETPLNQVTTTAVRWGDSIVVPSGEVRPRVRTPAVYRVRPVRPERGFGTLNYLVLFGYLFAMVGVGVYFAGKNKDTNDYFRGGKQIPWWAAGCSIFATMLSSLTYTGIPSKAYAQDCVYAIGNFMIPVVAIVAVYVALPFFRRIDATSAYEYLEKRFSRPVRWFGSASFTLFHLFRMAVVMSLTGLALAVATPLTPPQSVMLMGALSILYCTLGGVEAVVWTDTLQTFVLLGGAVAAWLLLVLGCEGGVSGYLASVGSSDKLNVANWHLDATSSSIALWVVIVGAIGQNLSSYTADQAVVQRYMTTRTRQLAARSIWTNAVLTVPATVLFFGIGTALFAYYQSHPEKLDPTITTDQVFPLFIAREMPMGLAGLIVAGVFAAAQSTVSTSMNSTATAIVTDFLRPCGVCRTEGGYLAWARGLTLTMGLAGTAIGLVFVDPQIKSLFDTFITVIGLFMGVLGGLFVLGALSTRANAFGALMGGLIGAAVMAWMWSGTTVHAYLYTSTGIGTCVVTGWLASRLTPPPQADLAGLTVHTLE